MIFAQIEIVGLDRQIELEALRFFGSPKAAPPMLHACPPVQVGMREFAAEVSWDLPSLAPGATSLIDVTVSGVRAGDMASASLASLTRIVQFDAAMWSNKTLRMMSRNISGATFDLAAATLSVGVVKRRVP